MRATFIILFLLSSIQFTFGQQLQLEISGSANFDNAMFTVKEAGLDFASVLENESSVLLTLFQSDDITKKNNPNSKWRIAIYKQDDWSDDLLLEVKRAGSGKNIGNNGKTNIHGGENYQVIRKTEGLFFEGMGEIRDIPLNLKLSGFSVTMGAGSHNSRIVFTVYEGW
ncbi:hypothetical protein OU798_08045 [Prolixibacteraceae bacterium Z1-6]|uniref:Uncharacterized protein n=1 Tax=Draconibacterium aestuarii TaxID=2998507 RepID=A0A9X3F458_9BACT|nr:hypothetical protein [Prolixibacteraceae bacterium Z1-6]